MTAVYAGAGDDLSPAILFPSIKRFIYIDSQPLTEYGGLRLFPGCSRPNFVARVEREMQKNGFTKLENTLEYHNPETKQCIKYYMNCCFPRELSAPLLRDIKTADTLICCGHVPSEILIRLMKDGPKTFIGNNITCYKNDNETYWTVDQALRENPDLFHQYIRFDVEETDEGYDVSRAPITFYKNLQELDPF